MNIVFDLGGVVFHWDFAKIIDRELNSPQKRNIIIKKIFYHNDWAEFDKGTLSLDDVVERSAERTKLKIDELERVIKSIPHSLEVNNKTLDLIQRIKNSGTHNLFVLSNMPTEFTDFILENFSFWNLFDGVIFSCRIKMVKPDLEIYDHLITKYSINPKESIFIDDREENLIPATSLGMKTIEFISATQCEDKLIDLGIF